jgi:hypothetical protein
MMKKRKIDFFSVVNGFYCVEKKTMIDTIWISFCSLILTQRKEKYLFDFFRQMIIDHVIEYFQEKNVYPRFS